MPTCGAPATCLMQGAVLFIKSVSPASRLGCVTCVATSPQKPLFVTLPSREEPKVPLLRQEDPWFGVAAHAARGSFHRLRLTRVAQSSVSCFFMTKAVLHFWPRRTAVLPNPARWGAPTRTVEDQGQGRTLCVAIESHLTREGSAHLRKCRRALCKRHGTCRSLATHFASTPPALVCVCFQCSGELLFEALGGSAWWPYSRWSLRDASLAGPFHSQQPHLTTNSAPTCCVPGGRLEFSAFGVSFVRRGGPSTSRVRCEACP